MPDSIGSDLTRLMRRTFSGGSRAPWWVSWLLRLTVIWIVVTAGAGAIDYFWETWLGRAPWAYCGLLGLMPWGVALIIGLVLGMVGIIAAVTGNMATGLGLLFLGALIHTLPEIVKNGLGTTCT